MSGWASLSRLRGEGAKALIRMIGDGNGAAFWIPAFAGMTVEGAEMGVKTRES